MLEQYPAGSYVSCPRCKSANRAVARWCRMCGESMIKEEPPREGLCLNCQGENNPGAAYCQWCGKSLAASATSLQQVASPTEHAADSLEASSVSPISSQRAPEPPQPTRHIVEIAPVTNHYQQVHSQASKPTQGGQQFLTLEKQSNRQLWVAFSLAAFTFALLALMFLWLWNRESPPASVGSVLTGRWVKIGEGPIPQTSGLDCIMRAVDEYEFRADSRLIANNQSFEYKIIDSSRFSTHAGPISQVWFYRLEGSKLTLQIGEGCQEYYFARQQ